MNDEIKKILINGYKAADSRQLEREMAKLAKIAEENTDHVYACIMENIVKEYQAHPLREYIQIQVMFHDSYYGKYNDEFTYNATELTKEYNAKYGYDLLWGVGGPCIFSLIKRKLEEDGFSYRRFTTTLYDIMIDTKDFKRLIEKLMEEDNQKHR